MSPSSTPRYSIVPRLADFIGPTARLLFLTFCIFAFSGAACSGCDDTTNQEVPCEGADCVDPGYLCGGTLQCATGEVCYLSSCTTACAVHADCGDGKVCGRDRYCLPGDDGDATCSANADCDSRRCDDGQCAPARSCDNDSTCLDGEFCSLDGVCVPKCQGNMQC